MMHIFVKGLSAGTYLLKCEGDETIAQLKERISALGNLEPQNIFVYAGGIPVADHQLAEEFENIHLELTVGLLGGKVHGSLARAGKVRGQTPKVEKQEKKKKKTGRAKKRAQYNKRFVNGENVFGPGRGHGPNSNFNRLL